MNCLSNNPSIKSNLSGCTVEKILRVCYEKFQYMFMKIVLHWKYGMCCVYICCIRINNLRMSQVCFQLTLRFVKPVKRICSLGISNWICYRLTGETCEGITVHLVRYIGTGWMVGVYQSNRKIRLSRNCVNLIPTRILYLVRVRFCSKEFYTCGIYHPIYLYI